jgi:hypothetical protein
MTRIQRIFLLALTAALALTVAAPAFGADHTGEAKADTTDTTAEAVPISVGDQPAIVIPPPSAEEPEQPWTSRFLIPLLVVTAIALVIGVVIAYNRSVRNRYRVVA